METSSYGLIATVAAGLGSRFGDGLSLERLGDTVRWSFEGAAAIVSRGTDGTLDATFFDAPAHDAVAANDVCCVYRTARAAGYALDHDGAQRIASDMTAFFSGIREPRFTFVGAA